MNIERPASRREFLKLSLQGASAALAASALVPVLSACKQKQPDPTSITSAGLADGGCPEKNHLTEQDRSIRASLKYVDSSPLPDRTCDNCKLYTAPKSNASCGGCKIISGPIHPKGYCTAWIHLM